MRTQNTPKIGTATNPCTTMNTHDGNVLCEQLKWSWMGKRGTSTDPIIENRVYLRKWSIGWNTFMGSVVIGLIMSGAACYLPEKPGSFARLLAGIYLPLFIMTVGATVMFYLWRKPPYTFHAYNPQFLTLVDAVGFEHFMECWKLNNRFAFPMLHALIKKQLVLAALVVLKLEDNGQRSEAETAKDRGFKPLHQAALAFGNLVEEKWDSYFLEAEAMLLSEKAAAEKAAENAAALEATN